VEHPKFEGHVTPNEEEYQKSVRLNLGGYWLAFDYMHIG